MHTFFMKKHFQISAVFLIEKEYILITVIILYLLILNKIFLHILYLKDLTWHIFKNLIFFSICNGKNIMIGNINSLCLINRFFVYIISMILSSNDF